ncbi:MAG: hypothetical protein ACOX7P_07200 [Oscillospiraceae bacterium]
MLSVDFSQLGRKMLRRSFSFWHWPLISKKLDENRDGKKQNSSLGHKENCIILKISVFSTFGADCSISVRILALSGKNLSTPESAFPFIFFFSP